METAGGGGDKVAYKPYADLDAGLNRVLSNIFAGGVYVVKDPSDAALLRQESISFVFRPTIQTTSSSRNLMFWPPTDFWMTISCTAVDASGHDIWSKAVTADGGLTPVNATLHEHGITGRQAAEAALLKLQAEITRAAEFCQ